MIFGRKAPSIGQLKKYVRATNYIGAAQIYLKENFLLERPLESDDIKPRLLGHWGTVPGINFTYAFCNYLAKKYDQEILFVLGPGHGFPAIQANLFVEGTLSEYYKKEIPYNNRGLSQIIRKFSWPYGYPSHAHPGAPGTILEGGELGYALSTSFGSVLDNPDLITVCLIGDGEAETGPTATAWHVNKFLDPKTCGAVLPIVHVNGYKISGPTVYGRMNNAELSALFVGYGYRPLIVEGSHKYRTMRKAMEKAYAMIKDIQHQARHGKRPVLRPRWPMIILRTLKGWTGIHKIGDQLLEGNCLSHQVIAKNCKTDDGERELVEQWFRSYRFDKLYTADRGFSKAIHACIPPKKLRMGMVKYAFGGEIMKPLKMPDLRNLHIPVSEPGKVSGNSMFAAGDFLREIFRLNKQAKNFRLMSPDETYSNKLMAVFKETTRAFMWPIEDFDTDMAQDGRVMEMLSEHTLQGLMQGYVLTGRHALFASYEAFVQIVASMADQFAKFLKQSQEYSWRKPIPSMNYILTSLGWRQDHNGFSHQNPGFVANMLMKHGSFVSVYFPADANAMLAVMEDCLQDRDRINIIVAGKNYLPQWRTLEEARQQQKRGLAIWDFASLDDPDIVFSSAGDYPTQEALAGLNILRFLLPHVKARYVNVSELTALGLGDENIPMTDKDFIHFFTHNKPIVFNFHGYPSVIKEMFFARSSGKRIQINGYTEQGSTTTPFDLQIRNGTSRYQLVLQAVDMLSEHKVISGAEVQKVRRLINAKLKAHRAFVRMHGVDPEELSNWKWGEPPVGFVKAV